MEQLGTVLAVSETPAVWADALDLLSSQYCRILVVRSASESKP
jgi:hypothetical protein